MDKLCEVQVSYRPKIENSRHPAIRNSDDIEALRWRIFSEDTIEHHEQFVVLFLNRMNRVLGFCKISEGGMTSVTVDVKLIMQRALLCNASAIIVAHNHPSGCLKPSKPDDLVTRKIKDAGKTLDIPLLDHVIMTTTGYYSYSDNHRIINTI